MSDWSFGTVSPPPNQSQSPSSRSVFGANPRAFGTWGLLAPNPAHPAASAPPQTNACSCTPPNHSQPNPIPASSLPTDIAALHTIIHTLQAELQASASVNTHLAASVARQLQAEQVPPTPTPATTTTTSTTTTTATPLPEHPCTIASGRGAASPEVFQRIIKTNWHGRLGRTHMVDVDSLPATALSELDCLVRRKLQAIYPLGRAKVESAVDADTIFASLAALGLRLEDRGAYVGQPVVGSSTLSEAPTVKRVDNSVAYHITHGSYGDYWHGFALETLMELGKYRGLFDDNGFLKVE